MWASVIWCVLSAQLSWCAAAAKKATHIIRFLDAEGVEHYGHAEEGVDVGLAAAGGGLTAELIDGDIFGSLHRTGVRADVVKLLAPVPMPPVIYGIGLNYRQHAIDANLSIPLHPAVFFKNRHSHNDPLAPVVIPRQSSLPDYEGELAVVLSKDCKDATLENALECVLGYTVANDVSARCWQADTSVPDQCLIQNETYHPKPIGQWSFSKSFDTHCPLGPALVTVDVLGKAAGLQLQTHLNGKLMQDDSTKDMIFDVPHIIAFLTAGTTLDKGTVIVTGTPTGIGYTQHPPVLLQDGDNMTVSIEHIGSLTNFVQRNRN